MKATLLTTPFAFLFTVMAAHAANVIVNGDFQTGTLTPFTTFTTVNGTNGGGGLPDVASFNTTGSGASLAAQFNVGGVSSTGLAAGGGLDQAFSLTSGGTFTYFANIASQDDADGQVNTDAGTYSILIDGITLDSQSLGGFSSANQILTGILTGSVNLTAGAHTFEILITRNFLSSGTATPTEYVDNISLTSAAPEPATLALSALTLIGLSALRFGRKHSS